MPRTVTFKGNQLHLAGRPVKVGAQASDFKVAAKDLSEVRLADLKGKVKILTSFPSIDTPVCDLQVKEFNKQAADLTEEVVIAGFSMDLPFAQARFCQANDITGVQTYSDYHYASFGINYGLLVRELGLLARAVIIVDKTDTVRYVQIVGEITNQPDYKDVLDNLKRVLDTPASGQKQDGLPGHCVACEGGVASLPKERVQRLMAEYSGWEVKDGVKIHKEYTFKDFSDAKFFVDLIAAVAETEGHHPSLALSWGKVRVTLTTHAAKGLSENDFVMARIIDEMV